jgi:alpha-beta hydrolase superfamily lysophospholipase
MKSEEDSFTGAGGRAGGLRIYWQAWLPDEPPRALVLLLHGAGEHSGRYDHVADALIADGYAVYALDHRGHGHSDGPRAVLDRMASAVVDVETLRVLALDRHPQVPVYVLGHSMGGTVALAYALSHQRDAAGGGLAGLILSGPLAALEAAPAPMLLAGRVLSRLAPRLPLISIDASLVSRDPAVVEAYVQDPLVHHGKLPARTVGELAGTVARFPESVGILRLPTLILYGTEDRLAPPAGSQMLGERMGSEDLTVIAYPGLFHEIFNEPERDEVLAEVRDWLKTRVGDTAGEAPAAGSTTS